MGSGELKVKVARGVAWSIGEKVGTMLLQMGVSIVVLRLLTREDFGLIAILTVFSTFALVVVDSGFSQTLVRRTSPLQEDYKSVFLFNVTVSVALYLLLVALSPLLARYYAMPELTALAPVFFLLLPVNALCVIQQTLFTRQFRFALLSKVTFAASLVSGVAAVALALAGFGVWSIVAQRVLQMAVRALLLWWLSSWRPSGSWSVGSLRRMAPYSFSLMASDLFAALYTKIPQLFIGKLYTPATLGSYDQAQKLKDLPITSTMQAVQGVIFPALAKIKHDAAKFAESYRQIVMVVAYALFPVMAGMAAIAQDMFAVLVGRQWLPAVPYFEVLCLAGLFWPVAMVAYNVLKVKADGRTIFRLEVAKKAVLTVIFIVTIPRSVMAVVWGLALYGLLEMLINVAASLRLTLFTFGHFLRTLLPVAAVTALMFLLVRLTELYGPANDLLRLVLEVVVGVAVYVGLSALFRLEAFGEVVGLVRRQLQRRR